MIYIYVFFLAYKIYNIKVTLLIIDETRYIYMFHFFTLKINSIKAAILVIKTFLFKIFLIIFNFLIEKITI